MADVAGEEAAAYWSQDDSGEEQQMVYIPGLCREGNSRPVLKTKNLKTVGTKAVKSRPNPAASMDLLSDWRSNHCEQQVVQPEAGIKSASLKDLCPEDKRRIANLIKELARVSEEKEVTEERLKTEHESFEKKIRHLEEQNNLIATEREALQQQYRECQELLSLYQKYLSEQQEKLSPRSSRPQQVPKTPRQPSASELNGSYLAPQNHRPGSDRGSLSSVPPRPLCRSEPTSRNARHCIPDRCASENCLQNKCPGVRLPPVHYAEFPCSHHCSSALKPPVSHCCLHPPVHDPIGRVLPDLSGEQPPEDLSVSRCSTMSGISNTEQARVKDLTAGRAISEQRRQELLLQKMEVEIEKERLQQLLVQQEVKLLEKQQQLQEARLQANRPWANPEIQSGEMAVVSTPLPGAVNRMNGSRHSPVIPTSSTSKSRRKPQSPIKNVSEGRVTGLHIEGQGDRPNVQQQSSVSKESRKDAATSPTVKTPKMMMKAARTWTEHRDLYRYETSLIDMLEAISPISSERRRPPQRRPCDFSIHSPSPCGKSKPFQPPVRRHGARSVDPEEREMLEDIFFIC